MMARNGCLFTQINITMTIRGLYFLHVQKYMEGEKKTNKKKSLVIISSNTLINPP